MRKKEKKVELSFSVPTFCFLERKKKLQDWNNSRVTLHVKHDGFASLKIGSFPRNADFIFTPFSICRQHPVHHARSNPGLILFAFWAMMMSSALVVAFCQPLGWRGIFLIIKLVVLNSIECVCQTGPILIMLIGRAWLCYECRCQSPPQQDTADRIKKGKKKVAVSLLAAVDFIFIYFVFSFSF